MGTRNPGFEIGFHNARDNQICVQLFFQNYWSDPIPLSYVFTDESIDEVLQQKDFYQQELLKAISNNIIWRE